MKRIKHIEIPRSQAAMAIEGNRLSGNLDHRGDRIADASTRKDEERTFTTRYASAIIAHIIRRRMFIVGKGIKTTTNDRNAKMRQITYPPLVATNKALLLLYFKSKPINQ